MEIKEEPLDSTEIEAAAQRASQIINQEFKREIEERENEMIRIQELIQTAKRCLHILKYAASYEYYEQGEIKKEEGEGSVESAAHPCVKKFFPSQMNVRDIPQQCQEKEDENAGLFDTKPEPTPEPLNPLANSNVTIVRGTYMVKHQLVIGNVSKWIPPAVREDEATHKWMLYVRDKGKESDMAKIIKKVRYFLHESYKPHDIIDVTSSPFHLTRRGWGEFPVRATIFFYHPSNKPINVVHQLKLDHTFTGTQMLGGETVIEINLVHDDIDELVTQEKVALDPPKRQSPTKLENIIAREHNYFCTDSASRKAKEAYQAYLTSSQPLIDGDDISELEVLNKWDPETDVPIVEWYTKNIVSRASNTYFFSTEACVKWLLRSWPLITHHALYSRYRNVHPYAFPSAEAYCNANEGRRVAAEWYLAWKINKMLQQLNLASWSTKQILVYSRMHGYTSFIGKQYFNAPSLQLQNISTYTNIIDTTGNLRLLEECMADDEVDVVGQERECKPPSPIKRTTRVKVVSPWVQYVEAASKQINIRFGEDVHDGVTSNAASVVLGHALKRFVDNLLRTSCCNAWLRNNCRNPGSLEVADIVKSIVESPEFDILTNDGLGSKINSST